MVNIYLDTSVINFPFADDAPEKKEATIDFFDNFIGKELYSTFISEFVLQEIMQTTDVKKREMLMDIIEKYDLELLEITDYKEVDDLADLYIRNKVIPEKKRFDALHIACSVIYNIDYLVSWHYQHLANVNKERKVMAVNLANNYLHNIRIITPLELMGL